VEILLWALLYRGLGLFPALEGSLYFSGITFTTVGYGDMTLPACWRLLSVAEAVNGVLMAGWSTAQLVYVVQRITLLRLVSEGRLP
jgi:voltage-gated potassium channel Kch